jgi:hypothetical protein
MVKPVQSPVEISSVGGGRAGWGEEVVFRLVRGKMR